MRFLYLSSFFFSNSVPLKVAYLSYTKTSSSQTFLHPILMHKNTRATLTIIQTFTSADNKTIIITNSETSSLYKGEFPRRTFSLPEKSFAL